MVLAASLTNHDAFAVVLGNVAENIEPWPHSSNLNVLRQVFPDFVSAKTHMMKMVIFCTKTCLVNLIYWFEIFQNVVAQTLKIDILQ